MENADALKVTRATTKAQFTRSEKKLYDSLNPTEEGDPVPIATVKRRFDDLVEKWTKAQDTHDNYIAALGDTADLAVEDTWINDICKRFEVLEVAVDKHIENVEKAAVAQQPPLPATAGGTLNIVAPKHQLKLDLKLDPFCGDIRKYPEFKETFIKHVETECSAEKHAFVLRNHLSDDVKEEVSNIGDDYEELWKRLDKKYGDVGKLVDSILFQIKSLPLENSESQSTLNMIKIVEKAYRDLERLKQQSEMHNATTISMIEERLPLNIRHEWVKLVAGKDKLSSAEKFAMLLELLTDWRCRLEYASDSIRLIPEQPGKVFYLNQQQHHHQQFQQQQQHYQQRQQRQQQSLQQGIAGAPNNNIQKPSCWFHESKGGVGDHPIWRCRAFQSHPVPERVQLVILNKACQVCLLQTHQLHRNIEA